MARTLRPNLTAEFLRQEYHDKNKSLAQIGEETGYSADTVARHMKRLGVESKYAKPSAVLTREVLEEMYLKLNMSTVEIATALGIKSSTSIRNKLREYGIKRRRYSVSKSVERRIEKQHSGCGDISGSYWCQVRNGARDRGFELSITIEDAWQVWLDQGGLCALTGLPLRLVKMRRLILNHEDEQTASLDRIDSEQGYVPGNVQWVHKRLQRMKMNMSDADFIYWCSLVTAHNEAE